MSRFQNPAKGMKRNPRTMKGRGSKLRRIIDSVPALIAYVDAQGRYRLNNHSYETWFGRPAGQLAGKSIREIVGEKTWESIRPHVEAALSGKKETFESVYRGRGSKVAISKPSTHDTIFRIGKLFLEISNPILRCLVAGGVINWRMASKRV